MAIISGWRVQVVLMAVLVAEAAHADAIYTCTDAAGRRITSDRPIAECNDRVQKELNPSGTVRRDIGPSLTAEERARADAQARQQAEEKARQDEERRRDRALVVRYPNKAAHDKARTDALTQIDAVIHAAEVRQVELRKERIDIAAEMEFYKKDPSKAPSTLKRRIEDNDHSIAVQQRFIVDQQTEKARTNSRFDEELVRLRQLWGG